MVQYASSFANVNRLHLEGFGLSKHSARKKNEKNRYKTLLLFYQCVFCSLNTFFHFDSLRRCDFFCGKKRYQLFLVATIILSLIFWLNFAPKDKNFDKISCNRRFFDCFFIESALEHISTISGCNHIFQPFWPWTIGSQNRICIIWVEWTEKKKWRNFQQSECVIYASAF